MALSAIDSARSDANVQHAILSALNSAHERFQDPLMRALIHVAQRGDKTVLRHLIHRISSPISARALPRIAPEGWCDMNVMATLGEQLDDNHSPTSIASASLEAFEQLLPNCKT